MKYDQDKVDEVTLALLYLLVCEKHEESGTARAWKSFDWDINPATNYTSQW